MIEYTLTINKHQCHEILKAVELLMRMKLGQYQEIVYTLCDINNPAFAERLSEGDTLLKCAFEIINKGKKPSEYKDDEWFMLYDLYQVLRKAVHDAEHPNTVGIDNTEPMQMAKYPLPKIRWE